MAPFTTIRENWEMGSIAVQSCGPHDGNDPDHAANRAEAWRHGEIVFVNVAWECDDCDEAM